jgi:hypothetical protein
LYSLVDEKEAASAVNGKNDIRRFIDQGVEILYEFFRSFPGGDRLLGPGSG